MESPDSLTQTATGLVSIDAVHKTTALVRAAENEVATIVSRQQQVAERRADLQAKAEDVMHQLIVAQQEEREAVTSLQVIIDNEVSAQREVARTLDALSRVKALLIKAQGVHESVLAEKRKKEASMAPISIRVWSTKKEHNKYKLLAEIESAHHQTELAHQKEQLLRHQVALEEAHLEILTDPSTEQRWYEVRGALE